MESSIQGKMIRELIAHFSSDLLIGKKIKWRPAEKARERGAALALPGRVFMDGNTNERFYDGLAGTGGK